MSWIKSETELRSGSIPQSHEGARTASLARGLNCLLVAAAGLMVTFNSASVNAAPAIEVRDSSKNIANVDGTLSLASVVRGQTGPIKTITLVNNTNTGIVLQPMGITSGSGFSIVRNFTPNQQCASGTTATCDIRLDSATSGYKAAVVRFGTSVPAFASFSFKLVGAVTNGGIVIDNADLGFSSTGVWTSAPGYGGDCKRATGSGTNTTSTATWTFTGLAPGKYNVDISYFGNGSLTGNAQYLIRDGGVNEKVIATPGVNQQYQPFGVDPIVDGQPFGRLATVILTTRTMVIQTSNTGFPNKYYIAADAMQVVPVP
jgi:hypothetical protein